MLPASFPAPRAIWEEIKEAYFTNTALAGIFLVAVHSHTWSEKQITSIFSSPLYGWETEAQEI